VVLGEILRSGIQRLAAAHVPSPRLNAELLLMFTLGCDRAYLYGHPERELNEEEQSRYDDALVQRSQGIPAQYITGHQEFWGMDFIVSPAVLIPRPETEHVVERVLELNNSRVGPDVLVRAGEPCSPTTAAHSATGRVRAPAPTRAATSPQGELKDTCDRCLRIVDVGTGSGCIALAIAKELPQAELNATEISPTALEVAHANAACHQFDTRICFHEADLLVGIEKNSFDFVVSNPPYVGESEEDSVQLEVRKFEPRTAVFAGPTGAEVIERLIPQAWDVLKPGGWLIMEISGTIADRVRELLSGWEDIQITNDLQGIPRVVSARKS
jgi:release factor glutamine methyltransferase